MSVKEITIGQDSFLDVIANLVGVLIILIVVIGAQANNARQLAPLEPNSELLSEASELKANLSSAADHVRNLEIDNDQLENQILREVSTLTNLTDIRHQMLVQLQIVEKQIETQKLERRQQLSLQQQAELDRLDERKQLEMQLAAIQSESNALAVNRPKSEVINHYPNPIAKTVFSDEVHFQLRGGKLVYVPLDELVNKMKTEWKVKAEKLNRSNRTVETVGPIQNFRLQYELETETLQQPTRYGAIDQQVVRFDRFTIFPITEELGVGVDQALAGGSEFLDYLRRYPAGKTTVSVWVYPDSYTQYNQVKDWLYQNGYQVACWPLDFNKRISGGPNGFRTSAQ